MMENKKSGFRSPMSKSERITGNIYLPIHMFLLPWLLVYIYTNVLRDMNVVMTSANLNLVYYVVSFVFVVIFLFRFLKISFSDLVGNLVKSLQTVVLAYLFNYLAMNLVFKLLTELLKDVLNPNTQAFTSQMKLDTDVMVFVAVLLVPIVEETLFRGALFGTIRGKSRVLAYVVSALLFSVYHMWQYFAGGFEWSMLLYLIQYIPPSLALAWCYERSGNIWSPIILHAAINFVSIQVTLG